MARRSRTTDARSTFAARASGSASRSSRSASAIELFVLNRHHLVGAARHQRQMRRVRLEHLLLVEHPLHRPPRQAEKRRLQDTPIEPEVDARDRRRPGSRPRPCAARPPAPCRRQTGRSARTRARRRRQRRPSRRMPRASTCVTCPCRRWMRAGAADAHVATTRFDEAPRRLRVQLVERTHRQPERRVPGSAAEHPREHGGKRRRGGLAHRLVQRGERQRLPQHLPHARVWPLLISHSSHRFARRRGNACGRLPSAPWLSALPAPCESARRAARPRSDRASRARPSRAGRHRSSWAPASADRRSRLRMPPPSTKSTSRFGCTRTRSSVPICRRNANVSS